RNPAAFGIPLLERSERPLAERRGAEGDGRRRRGRRMRQTFLPYGRQEITDEDVEAVVDALRSELITQGPLVDRFEEALAAYVGAAHVVAFTNGTAALHGAAFAAGLRPGDEGLASPPPLPPPTNPAPPPRRRPPL